MLKPCLLAGAACVVLSTVARAQPAVSIDMGAITSAGYFVGVGVNPGMTTWLSFSIPEVSRCQLRYLDLVTENFGDLDTEIGLYDSNGNRIANDDDSGVGRSSALSFGATSPLRPLPADGRPGDGRNGPLPAGTYYLAVGEFNTTFNDTNWEVIPDVEGVGGGCNLRVTLGVGDPVNDPPTDFWESLCTADAGDLPATAAAATGSGPLTTIYGFGTSRTDIDMYRICITDPANFEADTFLTTQMDTVLYLFDATGHGVTLNDDAQDSVQSQITSVETAITGPGVYYLAVAPTISTPLDAAGQPLWDSANSGERLADGPGGANPIAQWNQFVVNDNARYIVSLTGASFCPPAPTCGSADFNCDGDTGTDQDIEAFFACLAGNCPAAPCTSTADFNGDGDVGTDADIEAFFRVLAGGTC